MLLLPKDDRMFIQHARKGYYQRHTLCLGMAYVHNWRMAVDAGAHVGFFSRDMAKWFDQVHAFEPIPENFGCLISNVPENVHPHNIALGAEPGRTGFECPKIENSGSWYQVPGDAVKVKALDSYDLQDVGLIKIDTQGAEYEVLLGAVETIKRCQPVILMEALGKDENPEAIALVQDLGGELVMQCREDGVWAF